jgi:hypothetical protein
VEPARARAIGSMVVGSLIMSYSIIRFTSESVSALTVQLQLLDSLMEWPMVSPIRIILPNAELAP